MSPQAALAKIPSGSNTVESIIRELIDINSEIFELKEEIVAKGVPFNTVNALVELKAVGKPEEWDGLRNNALKTAVAQYGVGAIKPQQLDTHMDKLVELEEDLAHIRKLAKGNNMEPQAINLLTNIIRQNPGDNGTKVIGKIVEYARAFGITVNQVQLVASSEPPEPVSVLPDIKLPEPANRGLAQYKQIAIDICIGLFMACAALALLT